MVRPRAAVISLVVTCVVVALRVPEAHGADTGAMITVTPSSVAVGDSTRVEFSGWPEGVATAQVCGNAARRGSTDCEARGAGAARVERNGGGSLRVRVLAPPVGCPCVVRASTASGTLVRTAPIDIAGVPGGVDLAPLPRAASVDTLAVSVRLASPDLAFPESWAPAFGGQLERELRLTLRNRSQVRIEGLRVAGAVGRDATGGAPFAAPLPAVPAGATVTVSVPLTVEAPAWGDYRINGSVYGMSSPITFSTSTTNDPWALELAVPLLLLAVAQLLRARQRARRRRAERDAASPVFLESSPSVGVEDGGHWESSPYDRTDMRPAVPTPLDHSDRVVVGAPTTGCVESPR